MNGAGRMEISGQGYYGYSHRVLEALYDADDNMSPEMAAPHSVATQLGLGVGSTQSTILQQNRDLQLQHRAPPPSLGVPSAHMAAVLDQFEGMVPVQQQQQITTHPNMPPPPPNPRAPDPVARSSSAALRDTISSRVSSLSLLSNFSNRHLNDLIDVAATGDRGSEEEIRELEIRELVRQSESELMHIQAMNMNDFGGRLSSSDLRFTDPSRLSQERFSSVGGGAARAADSSSSSALMQRDTMLTIPPTEHSSPNTEFSSSPAHIVTADCAPLTAHSGEQQRIVSTDYPFPTAHSGQQQQQHQRLTMSSNERMSVDTVDTDVAEVLLRLSRDSKGDDML